MEKQEALVVLKKGHLEFGKVLKRVDSKRKVVGHWTGRDVVGHISEWYWEWIKEIGAILVDKPIMNIPSGDDAFNKEAVAKRTGKTTEELMKEWEEAFETFIKRVENLTESEWRHSCPGYLWPDGGEVSVESLFEYLKSGVSHEEEHAREIRKRLM